MLPPKWSSPPCTNIDVKTVIHEKAAGMSPNARTKFSIAGPSENSYRKTSVFTTINVTVMKGVVRDGMTSRRGIMLLPGAFRVQWMARVGL